MITDPLEVELLVPEHVRSSVSDDRLDADPLIDRPPAIRKGRDVTRLLSILDELDSDPEEGGMPA